VPVVIAEQDIPEVIALAQQICSEKKSHCIVVRKNEATDITEEKSGNRFSYKDRSIPIQLSGRYQVMNALCALKAIEIVNFTDDESAAKGVSKTVLPGRFQQLVIRSKEVVFDVAHNPQAVNELCNLVQRRFKNTAVSIITGIMGDKDAGQIVRHYTDCATTLIITRPDTPRAAGPSEVVKAIPEDFAGEVIIKETVEDALNYAFRECEGIICVTGSFYTVGEAMRILGVEPYTS
jgi:dihydrofolate synthase/folylpolyglutamate synthase